MKEQMEAAIQKAKPLMDESINAIYPQVSCFGSASFGAGGPMAWKDGFEAGWNADKWIATKDRLPEENGVYWAQWHDGSQTTYRYGSADDPRIWRSMVVAWQPLPAPFVAGK